MMEFQSNSIIGLSESEVLAARIKYGDNQFTQKSDKNFLLVLKNILKEPMVLLLFIASSIYFITGNYSDGIFLAIAILLVSAISLFQEARSRNALSKLKEFIRPTCKVIRNGHIITIISKDIVFGDYIVVEEGNLIPADATVVESNDFSVNESILTGESYAVSKDQTAVEPYLYSGTLVVSGRAIACVTAIGNHTKLGKIGTSIAAIKEEATPLEKQINGFVRIMAIAGIVVFTIVWIFNFLDTRLFLVSLTNSLTLAMSILPEEIPVAFTTFMALGAWRLMKMGIIVKQIKTVEALGSATVICTDKTGTITQNKMNIAKIYTPNSNSITILQDNTLNEEEAALISMAMWASEPIPFDPMEIAIHNTYSQYLSTDERKLFTMFHEYPLSGKPPMMTHLYKNKDGKQIIAAKGAPEALLNVSEINVHQRAQITSALTELLKAGYRVLGVGEASFEGVDFPKEQQSFSFRLSGLIAFNDPPKANISMVLQNFYTAGIDVKIITGDNADTTAAIAQQIQFKGYENSMTGDELMLLTPEELALKVKNTHLFARMYPEAKLRIINALKAQQEVVAMVGDGVNDGPALKAAHIGIAMGNKGTEIAKQAASLIILDDDLARMIDAIAMGRKIYANLKKAIQYIISIHIPIILTVFIPLVLNWKYPTLFSPIHIIFLELIMGPTCSVVYENEPIGTGAMKLPPRPFTTTFFQKKELLTSALQGIAITIATLSVYQFSLIYNYNEALIRTMVFTVLISANIFLSLVNRSFYYSIFTTIKYKNKLVPLVIFITILVTALLLYFPPFTHFFGFEKLLFSQLANSIFIGGISVLWIEIFKWYKRKNNP